MTIKSDRWIREQSLRPTHVLITNERGIKNYHFFHNPPQQGKEAFIYRANNEEGVEFREVTDADLEYCQVKPMIESFEPNQVKHIAGARVISYGVSSYGYDARLAPELKIVTNANCAIIDPRKLSDECMVDAKLKTDEDGLQYALLPPNSFMLGHTLEWFNIPRDVLVICMGKSTWARAGVNVTVTPLEPEWSGQVVIEIANLTSLPVKIYPYQGICQFLFLQSDEACETSYADRGGKYQNQSGITHATV